MSKLQNMQSIFEFKRQNICSLEHIFCFLSELLFRHRFTLSVDLRRKPLLGARGKFYIFYLNLKLKTAINIVGIKNIRYPLASITYWSIASFQNISKSKIPTPIPPATATM